MIRGRLKAGKSSFVFLAETINFLASFKRTEKISLFSSRKGDGGALNKSDSGIFKIPGRLKTVFKSHCLLHHRPKHTR